MLELNDVHAHYGPSHVLQGVNLRVDAGQVATLLGRNGMGKTTTLRAILGLAPVTGGTIRFDGHALRGTRPYRIARLGIGYVPEGRGIFAGLTVRENLVMAARRGAWTLERVFALFPVLEKRREHWGHQLSGGEAQMLAVARALLTQPRLLLMDEATEGLAPLLREDIWRVVREIKSAGVSILLVDKHVKALLPLAGRHHVLSKGQVAFAGDSAQLEARLESLHQTLAI